MTADKSCATCAHADGDIICVNLNSEQCGQVVCERDSCEEWKGEGMSEIEVLINHIKTMRAYRQDVQISSNLSHIVLNALQEKLERENPQPLSLEQLREMDGQPVFIKMMKCTAALWTILRTCVKDPCATSVYGVRYLFKDYEREWIAYDRQPKEQTL